MKKKRLAFWNNFSEKTCELNFHRERVRDGEIFGKIHL